MIGNEIVTETVRDDSGAELKRGAVTNTIALLASNFRGIFTFLVARLLGPAALGTFAVAWATTDLLSKIGMFALDNTITTFIARAEAVGERARSKALFRLTVLMALAQCTGVALLAIVIVRWLGSRLNLNPQMIFALSIMLCAMPGVALYRICTAVSRGLKVMAHDIFSRGLTETIVTTLGFLIALKLGTGLFAPEWGALIGTTASGLVAFFLAASLFSAIAPLASRFRRREEARSLLTFSAPITAYDLLNAFIVRLDVITLACFIGRAPGVTLPVVGIYGAAVEVAGGLRKVNQIFNPILAPVVAGMTIEGRQDRAEVAFAQVAQWMLWVLLPLAAAIFACASLILSIYGPAFPQGSYWLCIIALACGTNAFVGLAETVITVQQPKLNLKNSIICCAVAIVGNIVLIRSFGATGAAFGILLPYVVFGFLRYRTLRVAYNWHKPWRKTGPPFWAALCAALPAAPLRFLLEGVAGQVTAALVFLAVYFVFWRIHRSRQSIARVS